MKRALALVFLTACPSPSPTSSPTPSSSPTPLPSPSPTPTPTPTPTSTPTASPSPSVDDPSAWFTAHGAAPPPNFYDVGACTAVRFGSVDALSCFGGPPLDSVRDGESTYALRVVVVDGGKAKTALTAPLAAGPLDSEVQPGGNWEDGNYITLASNVDADGVLTISEKPGQTCDKVLAQYKSNELAPHRRMILAACASRGKYVLRDGKLVRRP